MTINKNIQHVDQWSRNAGERLLSWFFRKGFSATNMVALNRGCWALLCDSLHEALPHLPVIVLVRHALVEMAVNGRCKPREFWLDRYQKGLMPFDRIDRIASTLSV